MFLLRISAEFHHFFHSPSMDLSGTFTLTVSEGVPRYPFVAVDFENCLVLKRSLWYEMASDGQKGLCLIKLVITLCKFYGY